MIKRLTTRFAGGLIVGVFWVPLIFGYMDFPNSLYSKVYAVSTLVLAIVLGDQLGNYLAKKYEK